MKAAAFVFLAAAAFAAALVLGAVHLGSAGSSPGPIALHGSSSNARTGPAHTIGKAVAGPSNRIEVPQNVEQTTVSSYPSSGAAGRRR